MSDKPTGVFVRLPLSEEQISAADAIAQEIAENNAENEWRFARHHFAACDDLVRSIGTPVTGGELQVVAYDNIASGYLSRAKPVTPSINLVRQSDAQAQIAALEAEVVRLRNYLERIDRLIMGNSDPVMIFCGIHASCTKALKGGAA